MTTTDTNLQNLVINTLTQAQFNGATKSENELYLVTDAEVTVSDISDLTATATEINVLDGITATTTELNYVDGVTSSIQTQLNGKLVPSDIINNVTSTTVDKPLSANQGKVLQDQITQLKGIGKFLALWDCTTGLPATDPSTNPYTYTTGDYYIISIVASTGGTNYKPDGTSYTQGTASTVIETETVKKGYGYWYDGNGNWTLMQVEGGTVTDVQVDGSSIVTNGVANINYNQTISLTYTDGTTASLYILGNLT